MAEGPGPGNSAWLNNGGDQAQPFNLPPPPSSSMQRKPTDNFPGIPLQSSSSSSSFNSPPMSQSNFAALQQIMARAQAMRQVEHQQQVPPPPPPPPPPAQPQPPPSRPMGALPMHSNSAPALWDQSGPPKADIASLHMQQQHRSASIPAGAATGPGMSRIPPGQPSQSLQLPAGQLQHLHPGSSRSPAPPPQSAPSYEQPSPQQPPLPPRSAYQPSPRFPPQPNVRFDPRFMGAMAASSPRHHGPPPPPPPQESSFSVAAAAAAAPRPNVPAPQAPVARVPNAPPIRFAIDPASLPPLLPKIHQLQREVAEVRELPPEQQQRLGVLQKQLFILCAAYQEQERRKVQAKLHAGGANPVAAALQQQQQQQQAHLGGPSQFLATGGPSHMFSAAAGGIPRGVPFGAPSQYSQGTFTPHQMMGRVGGMGGSGGSAAAAAAAAVAAMQLKRFNKTKGRKYYESDEETESESDADSLPSSPNLSPSAIPEEGLRRSTRNVSRKTYKDEVDLHLSGDDEDKKKEERSEGAEGREGVVVGDEEAPLHASYFITAPDESDAHVVERILAYRTREAQEDEDSETGIVEEYFVKFKNFSYLHAKWATMEDLTADKRIPMKVKRFHQKRTTANVFDMIDEEEPFNPDYVEVDRVLDMSKQKEEAGESVVHYLVKWKALTYEDSTWELEKDVPNDRVERYMQMCKIPPSSEQGFKARPHPSTWQRMTESPVYNGENRLREYQLEGLNWLLFNWYNCQNCILADEMGLGKTIQSISLLLEVQKCGIRGPFLVVAPLSTIGNWQREVETWSDMNAVVYHGSLQSRRMIGDYEMYHRDEKGNLLDGLFKFEVMITTYEMVKIMADIDFMRQIPWRVVIIDEAHRLKNKSCKLLEGLNSLLMEHKVLLTGTPLQNNVEELFSLLNFLEPARFANEDLFLQEFSDLKTDSQVQRLQTVLKPMMLRRLKEDVERDIAAKEETIIEVELTSVQKRYYRAILERNFKFLAKGARGAAGLPSLMNVMMELRKCCNHPFLINGAEEKITNEFNAGLHPNHPRYKHPAEVLVQASGKLVLISKLLPKLKSGGHKVLVFSQMIRVLDILEDYLNAQGHIFERIDGRVRGSMRQAAIDRFCRPDSDRFVFLLCTRAGGLGINLTAADTVIIFDSDWNPQNDLQAQARCHRIGQSKAVKVYRLITRNTYEREMFDRASMKLGLDKAVLQSMNTTAPTGQQPLSKKEVEDLLKRGAYGSVMDDDKASSQFCEEDIEQILERRTQIIQIESEGKGSTFAKASFALSEGALDIDIDDPDFWEKWAQKADLDMKKLSKSELILNQPRQRKQTRRYAIGSEDHDATVDYSDSDVDADEMKFVQRGGGGFKVVQKGYSRAECFKVEKHLLTFGWGRWKDILAHGNFKRKMTQKDIEAIARMMCVFCLHCCKPDERIRDAIMEILSQPSVAEDFPDLEDGRKRRRRKGAKKISRSAAQHFGMQDLATLMDQDPNVLFEDEGYKRHLQNHSNKVLNRMRQLYFLEKEIIGEKAESFWNNEASFADLDVALPTPEGDPPASWWDDNMDRCLLIGVFKYGYEKYLQMYDDPLLCFRSRVGRPQLTGKKAVAGAKEDEEEEFESQGDIDGTTTSQSDGSQPLGVGGSDEALLSISEHHMTTRSSGSAKLPSFPPPADVNTRFRRLVNAFIKIQRKEQSRMMQAKRERQRKEKFEEFMRQKEMKKAEMAQRWLKREELDFYRTLMSFGVVLKKETGAYDWSKFRTLAKLEKKGSDQLEQYYEEFIHMCQMVCSKSIENRYGKLIRGKYLIEPVSEDKASRVLLRIQLLSAIRDEVLPHPELQERLTLCQPSFDLPSWWEVGKHDYDLLLGVARHGLNRAEVNFPNDPELNFAKHVPEATTPTVTTPKMPLPSPSEATTPTPDDVTVENKSQDEDTSSSSPPPSLVASRIQAAAIPMVNYSGRILDPHAASVIAQWHARWPKEKVLVHRLNQIVFCVKNNAWPVEQRGLTSPQFMSSFKLGGGGSGGGIGNVRDAEDGDGGGGGGERFSDQASGFKVKQVDGLKMLFGKGGVKSKGASDSDSAGDSDFNPNESKSKKRRTVTFEDERYGGGGDYLDVPPKKIKGKSPKYSSLNDSDDDWGASPSTGGGSGAGGSSSSSSSKKKGKKSKERSYVADFSREDYASEPVSRRRPKRKATVHIEKRVAVINKETGERRRGASAPTAHEIASWLEANPDFEIDKEADDVKLGPPQAKKRRPNSADKTPVPGKIQGKVEDVRINVVNRETGRILAGMAAPRLCRLGAWLEDHPAFDVAYDWGPFVLQQNVLKAGYERRIASPPAGQEPVPPPAPPAAPLSSKAFAIPPTIKEEGEDDDEDEDDDEEDDDDENENDDDDDDDDDEERGESAMIGASTSELPSGGGDVDSDSDDSEDDL